MSAGAPSLSVPPGRLKTPRGIDRQQLDGADERDAPGVHQPVEDNRHGRLEPDDAERRAVELHHLLVGVVRRVIGRDHVDGAVGNPLEHRVAICRVAQRRVHLQVRVVLHRAVERLVGQREVVRRHLAA